MISQKEPWTINKLIAALIAIRDEHGNVPVRMADYEPVVAASFHEDHVVITDLDGTEDDDEDHVP